MCLWIHHSVHKWVGWAHLYKSPALFAPAGADLWSSPPTPLQMVWPCSPVPTLADHCNPAQIQVTALMGKEWEANQIMGGENGREWDGIFNLSTLIGFCHLHSFLPQRRLILFASSRQIQHCLHCMCLHCMMHSIQYLNETEGSPWKRFFQRVGWKSNNLSAICQLVQSVNYLLPKGIWDRLQLTLWLHKSTIEWY